VAVVGSTTIDRNVRGGGSLLRLGGATTYAGLTYRRRGLAVRVVTRVAAPHLQLLSRLAQAGIRIDALVSDSTTHFVNRSDGKQRTQEMPVCAEPIEIAQVRRVLDAVDCIHLGPLHPADIEAGVFQLLRDWPGQVVLDVQGLVRRVSSGRIVPGACDALPAALAAAAVLKADNDEIKTLRAAVGRDLHAVMAAFDIREAVVTAGDRGGEVLGPKKRRHAFLPEPAPTLKDPTGAGDVFFAAYIAARFAEGREIAPAARHAACTAARHVAGGHIPSRILDLSEAETGRLSGPAVD
jgi:sugar/nucleoside kinase (ribokinase family)